MSPAVYKPTSWTDGPLSQSKMQQMSNNDQYLYENLPRMQYNTYGIKKGSGMKVMAGILAIAPSTSTWSGGTFNFGSFFTAGCKPVVVTGTQPTTAKWRHHVIVKGIGTYYPDHRGIELHVGADYYGTPTKNTVDRQYVHFVAVGW